MHLSNIAYYLHASFAFQMDGFKGEFHGLRTCLCVSFPELGNYRRMCVFARLFLSCLQAYVLDVCVSTIDDCSLCELSATSFIFRTSHFCGMHIIWPIEQEVRFAFNSGATTKALYSAEVLLRFWDAFSIARWREYWLS